jgi:uncharacterized protein (DUF2252 family)
MVTKVQATAKDAAQETAQPVAPVPVDSRRQASDIKSLTVEERMERGRGLRARVPRSSHAFWAETPDRPDPIALLQSQEVIREQELIPIRHARMRVSAFAFYRGSAIVMAEDLARTPMTGIRTQLCGDAHISNFGLYASPERTVLFDINDFDETLPGPWEWDVKRLAASAYIAGRGNGFTEVECRDASLAAVRSYRLRMAQFATMGFLDVWYSHVTADDLLALIQDQKTRARAQKALGKTRLRNSIQALSKLTEVVNGQRIIASDPPLVMRITAENLTSQLQGLFDTYLGTLRGAQRRLLERYRIVDFASKVVGVGSVGTRCFILLLLGRTDDDPLFLQVKEAPPSVLERHLPKTEFKQQGERVVSGQELMQAASDITLGWLRGPERDFYVRQLRDMKGSVEIEALTATQLQFWADMCGWALARAHARSGDPAEIAGYLGASETFDRAVATFSESYANQAERDYKALLAAIKSGRIVAATAGV